MLEPLYNSPRPDTTTAEALKLEDVLAAIEGSFGNFGVVAMTLGVHPSDVTYWQNRVATPEERDQFNTALREEEELIGYVAEKVVADRVLEGDLGAAKFTLTHGRTTRNRWAPSQRFNLGSEEGDQDLQVAAVVILPSNGKEAEGASSDASNEA